MIRNSWRVFCFCYSKTIMGALIFRHGRLATAYNIGPAPIARPYNPPISW